VDGGKKEGREYSEAEEHTLLFELDALDSDFKRNWFCADPSNGFGEDGRRSAPKKKKTPRKKLAD